MKIGDIVQSKVTGAYGTVGYSTFGFSIHAWHDGLLGKSLGYPAKDLLEHWNVVDMPEGYRVHEYGGLVSEGESCVTYKIQEVRKANRVPKEIELPPLEEDDDFLAQLCRELDIANREKQFWMDAAETQKNNNLEILRQLKLTIEALDRIVNFPTDWDSVAKRNMRKIAIETLFLIRETGKGKE